MSNKSLDRERVFEVYKNGGLTMEQLSERFSTPKGTLIRVIKKAMIAAGEENDA